MAASAAEEENDDEEVMQLQMECYEAIVAEVKAIAEDKGVNYVNIINMVALRWVCVGGRWVRVGDCSEEEGECDGLFIIFTF